MPGSTIATIELATAQTRTNDRPVILAAITLVILTAWLWSPALNFGFVYDDHLQIESNPDLQSWSHLGVLLREPLWAHLGAESASPYYRPLFSLLLLVQFTLFGSNPQLWHLAGISLHLLVVLSLFFFLLLHFRRLLPAFSGACVFAFSPVAAEVVNWVSASEESLYTLLVLVALCGVLLSERIADSRSAIILRLFAVIALALAMFAKETAIVGVALVFVYDWLLLQRKPGRYKLLTYLALALPLAALLLMHPPLHAPNQRSVTQVISAIPYVACLALKKTVWPLPVSEFYDLWIDQTHSSLSRVLHVCTLVCAGMVLAWLGARSKMVAWSLLVILLPVTACLLGIYVFRDYDLFHDRYLYLSLVGIAVLFAALVDKLETIGKMQVALIGLVVLAGGEAFASRYVTPQFRSDVSLFSNAVEVAPQNVLALQLMAEAELQANDCRSALGYYQRAQQLRPDLWKTSFFLGVADLRCGLTAPAAEALSRAAAMDTATRDQAALAWYELARARLIQRDESGAETALTQAALRDPASHKIQALLAQVHAKTTAVQGHSGRP